MVDHVAGRLTRYPPGTALDETAPWASLPYDDVQGHMLAPVVADSRSLRLMIDTGAQDTLWLGEEGEPGDQVVTTTDATGAEIDLYYGDVDLEMAGEDAVTVPCFRAPSFPYFEQTVAALGGNLHGLLGLSSLRGRRFVIDGEAHAILLETGEP